MKFIYIEKTPPSARFSFARKAFHMLGLVFPLCLYFDVFGWLKDSMPHPTRTIVLGFNVVFLLVLIVSDILRFRSPGFRDLYYGIFGNLMKKEEAEYFNASIPYAVSSITLFLFFSNEVVVLACLLFMLGDPAAAFFGIKFGRIRFWNKKSLEGLLGFFVFGVVICILFLWAASNGPLGLPNPAGKNMAVIVMLLIGGAVAAVAELLSSTAFKGLVDDNLWVPLSGALGLALAGIYVSGFAPDAVFFDPALLFGK